MGFPPGVVAGLLDAFGVDAGSVVLDPFCGTGTTLLEARWRGAFALGLDANPAAVLVSRAKNAFCVEDGTLRSALEEVLRRSRADPGGFRADYRYAALVRMGLVSRGWLGRKAAQSLVAVARAIDSCGFGIDVRRLLMLALFRAAVDDVANIRFGPEVYIRRRMPVPPVARCFRARVESIALDLEMIGKRVSPTGDVVVRLGDARNSSVLKRFVDRFACSSGVDLVLTSPPYPNEHDYTRLTRIELVLGGFVRSPADLRRIKNSMMRSNTKNVFSGDDEGVNAAESRYVRGRIVKLERIASRRTDGFGRLYARVVEEYFGGLARTIQGLKCVVRRNGFLVLILGDQVTYGGVRVNCPRGAVELAAAVAPELRVIDIIPVRSRRNRRGARIAERAVVFQRVGSGCVR
jgi:SAM-dependent methyltransferase